MLSLCDKIHALLLSMPESIFDEMPDVIVNERVVRHLAISPVLHQPEIPQKAQLMGDRRSATVHDTDKIADAQFSLRECKQ